MPGKGKQQLLRKGDSTSKRRRISRRAEGIATSSSYDRATFNRVWSTLRRAGWSSRKPPGNSLSDLYRYVRPGGDANGEAGVDFFLGEEALLDHYNSEVGSDAVPIVSEDGSRTENGNGEDDNNDAGDFEAERVDSGKRCNIHGNMILRDDRTAFDDVASNSTAIQPIDKRDEAFGGADVLTVGDPRRSDVNSEMPHLRGTTILCAVCGTECTKERSCTSCGKFIHHFCSHDVCLSLNLWDSNGACVQDFGDCCYCSKLCYTRTTTLPTGEATLASKSPAISMSCITSDAAGPQQASLGTATAMDSSIRMSNTTIPVSVRSDRGRGSPNTQKHRQRLSKTKISPKKTQQKKSAVSMMKEELVRRARAAAEKYVNASVAFSPAEESWMPNVRYRDVGASYLIGVVARYSIISSKTVDGVSVPSASFQLHWTNTAFQTKDHVHVVQEEVIIRGIKQFVMLKKNNLQIGESWLSLCNMVPQLSNIPALTDEFEELDSQSYREWSAFRSRKELQIPLSPAETEEIQSMTFSATDSLGQPTGLYSNANGSTTSMLRQESREYFGHSATSAFFAFIPLSFWKQVVVFSNEYAVASGNHSPMPISLEDLMKFLGILWFMTLYDKGEMRNYWYDNDEESILPGARRGSLGTVMTWRRFLYIRQNLCFRSSVTPADIQKDPAARIRPLINILKSRCTRHVIVGRNVAVDEASVACRSRYARHIIVYNPRKPTGKYHFKFYMCCCSTTWFVVDFKLHCSSDLGVRMGGVVSVAEKRKMEQLVAQSSEVRSHVIEVTASLHGSQRIVNTDNFYTSCLLLESLRTIGLYGRGTVRASSKHFPHFTMIQAGDSKPRGYLKQGVCVAKHIVAASWVDGSIVNVVSNADASDTTTVFRRIKEKREAFSAPRCVSEYNNAMQGVDRHDQLRGRFSLASGHSFQKWHKKLAMALLDIAKCNAFVCNELANGNFPDATDESTRSVNGRDNHRSFVVELVRELFNGTWTKWLDTDNGLIFGSASTTNTSVPTEKTEL